MVAYLSFDAKQQGSSLIGGTMKYICLGYLDEKNWETMSESELNALVDECFAYEDLLRKNGHFVGSEALQPLGMPPHCDGRTARCSSPMARMPRRKSSWAGS